MLKNMIFDIFTKNLKDKLDVLNTNNDVFNYINLLSNLDENLNKLARDSLVNIFEHLDYSFSNSTERKRKYEIKSHHPRTILTIFGEITFNRTFYKSKFNNENYCFVDRYFGLHKYDYFDPYLKALVIDYASNNSMPKTAKYINDLIDNRLSLDQKIKFLSRQTVRNIIISARLSKPHNAFKENTPDTLYIIADEKFIHTQNNNHLDVMEKSIVLFENIKNHKLLKKQIFASSNHSFIDDCLDYIYNSYDVEKIKTIYCMGDGAKWIKSLRQWFNFNPKMDVITALDKFHFKQAVHHICLDKNLENLLTDYVINNEIKNFKDLCISLSNSYPYRSDTITSKMNYILSNWITIRNLYKYNLSCPMESQISHNIADLFSSRPKAYSKKMIDKLISIRLLFKNNYNIKKLFLNNFNSTDILTASNEFLNFNFKNIDTFRNPVNLITDYITSEWPFRY